MKLLLILSLLSYSAFALDNLKPETLTCINQYNKNPMIKYYFNELYHKEALPFLNELVSYCKCDGKILKNENQEIKEDWIKHAFKDKSKMLVKRDMCAMESFSSQNIKIHYQARFIQWFTPQIEQKINHHIPKGYQVIAGEDNWVNYLKCSHFTISKKCTKTQSLNSTYQCIKENFRPKNYDKTHKKCSKNLSGNNIEIKNIEKLFI